jgi:hypothetical protein
VLTCLRGVTCLRLVAPDAVCGLADMRDLTYFEDETGRWQCVHLRDQCLLSRLPKSPRLPSGAFAHAREFASYNSRAL